MRALAVIETLLLHAVALAVLLDPIRDRAGVIVVTRLARLRLDDRLLADARLADVTVHALGRGRATAVTLAGVVGTRIAVVAHLCHRDALLAVAGVVSAEIAVVAQGILRRVRTVAVDNRVDGARNLVVAVRDHHHFDAFVGVVVAVVTVTAVALEVEAVARLRFALVRGAELAVGARADFSAVALEFTVGIRMPAGALGARLAVIARVAFLRAGRIRLDGDVLGRDVGVGAVGRVRTIRRVGRDVRIRLPGVVRLLPRVGRRRVVVPHVVTIRNSSLTRTHEHRRQYHHQLLHISSPGPLGPLLKKSLSRADTCHPSPSHSVFKRRFGKSHIAVTSSNRSAQGNTRRRVRALPNRTIAKHQ